MKCLLVGVLCVSSLLGWVNGTTADTEGTDEGNGNDVKIDGTTTTTTMNTESMLKCYVCSWSSSANITNNIDTCSPNKFKPEASVNHPCEHGCQTVSYRNSRNQDLKHIYRNCLKVEKGNEPIDRCIPPKETLAYGIEQICECLTNLCNQSSHLHQTYSMMTHIISSSTFLFIFTSIIFFS